MVRCDVFTKASRHKQIPKVYVRELNSFSKFVDITFAQFKGGEAYSIYLDAGSVFEARYAKPALEVQQSKCLNLILWPKQQLKPFSCLDAQLWADTATTNAKPRNVAH